MAWDTGTITSATPLVDLSQKLKDLCGDTGVANWSFVENVPVGTGTGQSGSSSFSCDVFKCSGSGTDANASGTDWYFVIQIPSPTSGTAFIAGTAEDYEGSTNKRFRRHIPNVASSSAPVGAGFWFTDTLASWNSLASKYVHSATLNTSGFSYWIKLTNNAVLMATRVGVTETATFASLMDSFISPSVATDDCPLTMWSSSVGIAGFSRLPGVTNGTITKWNIGRYHGWTWTLGSNQPNDNDFWQSGKVFVCRILAQNSGATSGLSGADLIGGMRGLVKVDYLLMPAGGTIQIGDTMTIDGNTWTVVTSSSFTAPKISTSGGAPSFSSTSTHLVVRPT